MSRLPRSGPTVFLSVFVSTVALVASYILFSMYLRTTARELVGNWLEAESIALQEGNYLGAIAKYQRVLMSSDFIRGIALVDLLNNQTLVEFGESITKDRMHRGSSTGVFQVGLFKFLVATPMPKNDQVIAYFSVGPSYVPWAFAFFTAAIVAMSVFSLFLLRIQERKEFGHRENVVRTALNDLVRGFPPSDFLLREVPGLVRKWEEMTKTISASKKRESDFAREMALSDAALQIAHDIKSPLSALNMIASSRGLSQLPEAVLLKQVSSRISDIANAFLNRHHVRSELRSCKLWPILKQVIDEKKIEFRDTNIHIELSAKCETVASADPITLGRITSNIVNNAIQAVKGPQGHISLSILQESQYQVIVISDDGTGMEEQMLSIAGRKGVTNRVGGHGLGLYHARKTLEEWGGRLEIESQVGRGTTVKLKLKK